MYFIDTELYIDGSQQGNVKIGEDDTFEVDLKNSDITLPIGGSSLNRPRKIRKIALP